MRKKRLAAIIRLVREKEIQNQAQLIDELSAVGFRVTQSMVSRDISDLRLEKQKNEFGIFVYVHKKGAADFSDKRSSILKHSVKSVALSDNIVVIKCYPGLASAACAALDSFGLNEILGTIAGDDTIIAVVRDKKYADGIAEKISDIAF